MQKDSPPVFITRDTVMLAILDEIRVLAPYPVPVLVTGESGTGKEVVARLIHEWSGRGSRPFIPVNSAALQGDLLESSLYGHSRGAFTGAVSRQAGLAETADGGTLFLDEIGEMSSAAQARLLRFLDSGEYLPVGETRPRHSAARIIAATNRDLREEIADGNFREDLFYRLSPVVVRIPPLRERRTDILPLARHFISFSTVMYRLPEGGLSTEAGDLLTAYGWPGNVRQLRNEIVSAALRRAGKAIRPTDLSRELLERSSGYDDEPQNLDSRLMRYEKNEMLHALRLTGSNCSRAAELLGLKRTTFLYRMKRHGIILREKKV